MHQRQTDICHKLLYDVEWWEHDEEIKKRRTATANAGAVVVMLYLELDL